MSISRREFLQKTLMAAVGGGLLIPKEAKAGPSLGGVNSIHSLLASEELSAVGNEEFPFNIIQGPTNETVTQLAVDLPKELKVHYELTELSSGRKLEAQLLNSNSRSFSSWRVDHVYFQGLRLGEDYVFRVIDERMTVLDQRTLRALDTQKKNARLAIGSCMWEMNVFKDQMWAGLEKSMPDAMLLLGDNVYGDFLSYFHSPRILWYRYIASRRFIPLYHWPRLVPTFAVWDDHDYGKNDANGFYQHKANSYEVFKSFFPQANIPDFFDSGPGVASTFEIFGYRVVLLDGRYFRDMPSMHGTGLLGDEQLQWVFDIVDSTTKPLMLGLGTQFFSTTYKKNWESEFDALMKRLGSSGRPVLFTSGDVHRSETFHIKKEELGFETFEITSSSMHSVPSMKFPGNDRRIDGSTQENFVYLDLDGDRPEFDQTCVGRREKVRYRRRIQL